jgi:hypothetical protein
MRIAASMKDTLRQIPHKRIEVYFTSGPTYTQMNSIYISRSGSTFETKEAFWERALRVELGNMATQLDFASGFFSLVASAANAVQEEETTGRVSSQTSTTLSRQQAAYAVATELIELANCIKAFRGDGTSYASFFTGKSTVSALDWLTHQIAQRHTSRYDNSASSPTWVGLTIMESHRAELSAIPVSETGCATLMRLAETIRRENGLR